MTSRAPLNIQGNTSPVGVTGLNQRDGRISEEFNNAIRTPQQRFALFREMSVDATIAAMLRCVKLPLLAGSFTVEAGSDQASDIELARFIERNMFGMYRQSWRSHVRDMLEALQYGFSLGEIVLEKRLDGQLYLRNLEPRAQQTLDRWEFDGATVTAFIQRDPVTQSSKTIPIDKLIHLTLDASKGNPEGHSMLRPLYRTHKFKKLFELIWGIYFERGVGGMPVVHTPEYNTLSRDELGRIDNAMAEFRRDESTYLRLPFGVELSTYPAKSNRLEIGTALTQLKMDIFVLAFTQFLTLGTQETGTQALVQGDIDFFHLSLISIQHQLLEAWNTQLIPYLLLSNNIDPESLEKLPAILWSDPGKTNLKALMESFEIGVKTGSIIPTDSDEDYIRGLADLPSRTISTEGQRAIPMFDRQRPAGDTGTNGEGASTTTTQSGSGSGSSSEG